MSRCRGCGREIEWIRTRAWKTVPVDPAAVFIKPDPEGPERVVTDEGDVVAGYRVEVEGDLTMEMAMAYEMGFISHFATCPCAASFRHKK